MEQTRQSIRTVQGKHWSMESRSEGASGKTTDAIHTEGHFHKGSSNQGNKYLTTESEPCQLSQSPFSWEPVLSSEACTHCFYKQNLPRL